VKNDILLPLDRLSSHRSQKGWIKYVEMGDIDSFTCNLFATSINCHNVLERTRHGLDEQLGLLEGQQSDTRYCGFHLDNHYHVTIRKLKHNYVWIFLEDSIF